MAKRSASPAPGPSSKRGCHTCEICNEKFPCANQLLIHIHIQHEEEDETVTEGTKQLPQMPTDGPGVLSMYREMKCPPCNLTFPCRDEMQKHFYEVHPDFFSDLTQDGGQLQTNLEPITVEPLFTSLNTVTQYRAIFQDFKCENGVDERDFLKCVYDSSATCIKKDRKKWKNVKVFFSMVCNFTKSYINGTVETNRGCFTSFRHLVYTDESIPKVWNIMGHQMSNQIENFTNEGSGWDLAYISEFKFVTAKYQFTKIGTFIETPFPLSEHNKTLLNIDNSEVTPSNSHNQCFLWAVLAHDKIVGATLGRNRYKVDKKVKTYAPHASKVNTQGLHWPMTLQQLPRFEQLNPDISITVLGYDMDAPSPPPRKNDATRQRSKAAQKEDLDLFKCMQENISILYNSKESKQIHVDLMCLMHGNNAHFLLIRNLEALMKPPNCHRTLHICRNCLSNFTLEKTLKEHIPYCAALGLQKVKYPEGDKCKLKFDKWARTQPIPFRFYADFEAFLNKFDSTCEHEVCRQRHKAKMTGSKEKEVKENTGRVNIHKPCGYAWVCVDFNGNRRYGECYHMTDDDEDVAAHFVASILRYSKTLQKEVDEYERIAPRMLDQNMTREQCEASERETKCCFCEKAFCFGETRVRHHTHLPPFNYIGMAHQFCNIEAQIKKEFPVFLHNFSSYDVHFLIQSMGKLTEDKIIKSVDVIPKSSEKYLCVTITPEYSGEAEEEEDEDDLVGNARRRQKYKLRFTDSLGFTLKSLDSLVKVMRQDPNAKFGITRQKFQQEVNNGGNIDLLFKKGAYPYSLMKSCEDFEMTSLPPKEAFFNDLTESPIQDEVYEHAENVWRSFNIQNMGEWHDLYVRLDVSLLADVMEGLRKLMMDSYGLELGHYYSLPMMAIDCALKKSGVELELITDPTMHCWFERAIRGGYVSVGSQRSAVANNPFMAEEFNPEKPTSYITYIDANNLYGKSMCQKLPVASFRWLTTSQMEQILGNINSFMLETDRCVDTGYWLEVDLEIDPKLHAQLNDYPPAPITRTVTMDELSEHQHNQIEDLNSGPGLFKVKKLVADLNNKESYILHYEILKQYLAMGVKVTKIHRGVSFTQSDWMKNFIDFNTEMRKKATSDFAKDFWKLLNNSAFGKTIEQVRNRQNVRIVTTVEKALYYNKKPTVQNVIPINETTCIFVMKKLQVTLNKPIFTGVTVLDLAKSIMYRHHREGMQARYGDKCRLIYTDTDSFIYHIETKDLYQDMLENRELYDMSEYPADHPQFGKFHDPANKKVLGKFKDEAAGAVITHVYCPRPKMYTIRSLKVAQIDGEYQKKPDGGWLMKDDYTKKAKGITKTAVNGQVKFEDYEKVLQENVQTMVTMRGFRSVEHRIFTEVTMKRALNGLDTKRYAVDSVNTLAFGHKDIPK